MDLLSFQAMSDDEKAYYKEKAKGGEIKVPKPRSSASSTSTHLYTTHGVPVSMYEDEERIAKENVEMMRKRIGKMIQELPLMTGT